MSKPPTKGGTGRPGTPPAKPPGSAYQTRSATQATATASAKGPTQAAEVVEAATKGTQSGKGKMTEAAKKATSGNFRTPSTALQVVYNALSDILVKDKATLETHTKCRLEDIMEYIKKADAKERAKGEGAKAASVATYYL